MTIKTPEQIASEKIAEDADLWPRVSHPALNDLVAAGVKADRAQIIEHLETLRNEYASVAELLAGHGGVEYGALAAVPLLETIIKRLEA